MSSAPVAAFLQWRTTATQRHLHCIWMICVLSWGSKRNVHHRDLQMFTHKTHFDQPNSAFELTDLCCFVTVSDKIVGLFHFQKLPGAETMSHLQKHHGRKQFSSVQRSGHIATTTKR